MKQQKIKEKRKRLGCSQMQLALETGWPEEGVGRYKISMIENGYVDATQDEIQTLQKSLNKIEMKKLAGTP